MNEKNQIIIVLILLLYLYIYLPLHILAGVHRRANAEQKVKLATSNRSVLAFQCLKLEFLWIRIEIYFIFQFRAYLGIKRGIVRAKNIVCRIFGDLRILLGDKNSLF